MMMMGLMGWSIVVTRMHCDLFLVVVVVVVVVLKWLDNFANTKILYFLEHDSFSIGWGGIAHSVGFAWSRWILQI